MRTRGDSNIFYKEVRENTRLGVRLILTHRGAQFSSAPCERVAPSTGHVRHMDSVHTSPCKCSSCVTAHLSNVQQKPLHKIWDSSQRNSMQAVLYYQSNAYARLIGLVDGAIFLQDTENFSSEKEPKNTVVTKRISIQA